MFSLKISNLWIKCNIICVPYNHAAAQNYETYGNTINPLSLGLKDGDLVFDLSLGSDFQHLRD